MNPLPATAENLREGLEHFADHRAVCHGNSGAGGEHGGDDSWRLVQFIRHLPKITDQELAEMAKLNPRSPEDAPALTKPGETTAPAPHIHRHPHGGKG